MRKADEFVYGMRHFFVFEGSGSIHCKPGLVCSISNLYNSGFSSTTDSFGSHLQINWIAFHFFTCAVSGEVFLVRQYHRLQTRKYQNRSLKPQLDELCNSVNRGLTCEMLFYYFSFCCRCKWVMLIWTWQRISKTCNFKIDVEDSKFII